MRRCCCCLKVICTYSIIVKLFYGVVLMYIPDAGALAVAHHGVATESFGVRFDLLSNLLPPGVPRFWLICKTQIPLQAVLAAHSPMLQRGT